MRKSLLLVLIFTFAFALSATAQNDCVAVRGIAHEHLKDFTDPEWQGGIPEAPWAGQVELVLGDTEVLVGKVSEYDGPHTLADHQAQGGYFVFDFTVNGKSDGKFLVQTDNSVMPSLPKHADVAHVGAFHGQGPVNTLPDIHPGTGRFANATGNFTIKGDFMIWNLTSRPPSGRFNASFMGFLCGVTP